MASSAVIRTNAAASLSPRDVAQEIALRSARDADRRCDTGIHRGVRVGYLKRTLPADVINTLGVPEQELNHVSAVRAGMRRLWAAPAIGAADENNSGRHILSFSPTYWSD